ncbi:MAG: hypothetical protein ACOYL3_18180 [Desulfuromonadaceae bacterium]
MLSTNTIPAHYKQLQNELEMLIVKIRETLALRVEMRSQVKDFSQVEILFTNAKIDPLVSSVNIFASKVLKEFTASPAIVKSATEDLKYELFAFLARYKELCNKGFPLGYEDGHGLLMAVIKRPLEQILDVFENIVKFMNSLGGSSIVGNNNPKLHVTLNNDAEISRYLIWVDRIKRTMPSKNGLSTPQYFAKNRNIYTSKKMDSKFPIASFVFMVFAVALNIVATILCKLTKPTR